MATDATITIAFARILTWMTTAVSLLRNSSRKRECAHANWDGNSWPTHLLSLYSPYAKGSSSRFQFATIMLTPASERIFMPAWLSSPFREGKPHPNLPNNKPASNAHQGVRRSHSPCPPDCLRRCCPCACCHLPRPLDEELIEVGVVVPSSVRFGQSDFHGSVLATFSNSSSTVFAMPCNPGSHSTRRRVSNEAPA